MSSVDVAIIGGGIIGVSVAWSLAKRGCKVAVIERQALGQEASWAAGGILSPNAEFDTGPLHSLAQQSLARYPGFAQDLREESDIDPCLLSGGLLSLSFDPTQPQHNPGSYGLPLSQKELSSLEPNVATPDSALFFPQELSIDPRALFGAAAEAAKRAGVALKTNTPVRRIATKNGALTHLALDGEDLICQHVIVAAGSWSSLFDEALIPKDLVHPIKGQVALLAPKSPALSRVVYANGGYLVPRKNGHVLIGATSEDAGFSKELTAGGLQFLLGVATKTIPSLQGAAFVDTWAGLRPATKDGLPILGESHIKNVWFATGHYRNGILLTPITTELITSLITDEPPPIDVTPFLLQRFLSSRD